MLVLFLPLALLASGRVVAILTPSPKRQQVVGVLQRADTPFLSHEQAGVASLVLVPLDPRLPPGLVAATEVKGMAEELLAEATDTAADQRCDITLIF
jgi:hypothetical protein